MDPPSATKNRGLYVKNTTLRQSSWPPPPTHLAIVLAHRTPVRFTETVTARPSVRLDPKQSANKFICKLTVMSFDHDFTVTGVKQNRAELIFEISNRGLSFNQIKMSLIYLDNKSACSFAWRWCKDTTLKFPQLVTRLLKTTCVAAFLIDNFLSVISSSCLTVWFDNPTQLSKYKRKL